MPIVPLPEPSEYERTKSRLRGPGGTGAFGMRVQGFNDLYKTEDTSQKFPASRRLYSGTLKNPDDFPTHITGEPAAGISQFDNLTTGDIYKAIGDMQHISAHYQGSRPRSDKAMTQIDEIHDEMGVWDKEMRRRFTETKTYGDSPIRQGLVGAEGERRLPYPKVAKDWLNGEERRGIPINGSRAALELGSYKEVSNKLDLDARSRQPIDDPDPFLPTDWSQYFNK